ncbi:hypothetical protein KFV09_16000 [Anoxybacillus rupiensis]|uniref:hypothetical protein n=1 Tax=Anoxybacteroides rupiense TaxID=311460 RepID=UPI001BA639E6|nr:hypothetical protein [Anoxybacillus rupiensis]MBS2773018.1 hypothetical protein [Anoxybacillus rupiensis]
MTAADETIVVEILEKVVETINKEEDLSDINSGVKFEDYVAKVAKEIADERNVPVEQTGAQSFPDIIVAGSYGVEVKYSNGDKWQSTGNSIFEGTLRKEVTNQIYLLFGKRNGKKIEARFKKYEECLADIKVTHSPRFFIDMDIEKEKTILHAIGLDYHEFRKLSDSEKARKLKEYIKTTLSEGETLWWIDDTIEESISPKIKEFRNLKPSQKRRIMAESMVLFPEIFSERNTKYLETSVYLLREYQIVSSSLRDTFSAGGRADLIINGKRINVGKIYKNLFDHSKEIYEIIEETDKEKLKKYWSKHKNVETLTDTNKVDFWKELIDNLAFGLPRGLRASEIFEEGRK